MSDKQDFADFTPPGEKPILDSIFQVSAKFLGEFRLWLEQNPPAVPISSILGFTQSQKLLVNSVITASVTITATSEATADTVISTPSIKCDGTPVELEFYAPQFDVGTANVLFVVFYQDSATLGHAAQFENSGVIVGGVVKQQINPAAGNYTFSARAYVNANTATIGAGTAGAGNLGGGVFKVSRLQY